MEILKGYYLVDWVDSETKVFKYLVRRNTPPDLMLFSNKFAGAKLCQTLRQNELTAEIPVIFLIETRDEVASAFDIGASGTLQKPFLQKEVLAQGNIHISSRQDKLALRNYNQRLEETVQERTHEIIDRLVLASSYKDDDTTVHIVRMAEYSVALARTFGLSEKECYLILHAAPMHDIGKIGIPDRVLLKPGKLDAEEWKIMKTHSEIGAKILSGSRSELLQKAAEIALTHHEKWNGSGYPVGLTGEDIPLSGRIVALCDVFDALTMERPYKKAWPVKDSVTEIKKLSGAHFDPQLVNHFLQILPEILKIKAQFTEENRKEEACKKVSSETQIPKSMIGSGTR